MGKDVVQGMSADEKRSYLQALKKSSSLDRISDAIKRMADSAFGLSQAIFDKTTLAVSGIQGKYQDVSAKNKRFGMNQHVPGLTVNVRGKEQLIHEQAQQVNVDLPDGRALEKKRGLYIDVDWAPKPKGKLE